MRVHQSQDDDRGRDHHHKPGVPRKDIASPPPRTHSGPTGPPAPPDRGGGAALQRRRLRTPIWARSIVLSFFLIVIQKRVFFLFIRYLYN